MRALAVVVMLAWAGSCAAAEGPSEAALADAVRLGTVATLAPLCGMRDEAWAFDLRRATIFDVTKPGRPDDEALAGAPGQSMVVGALSFAEAEALESYAEAVPSATCDPLARDPELGRADGVVRAFRALKAGQKPGS